MFNLNISELKKEVIAFQSECYSSNCDCDCIIKEWNDGTYHYILDGYGRLYRTPLIEWNNRDDFFTDASDWIAYLMYQDSKNILN